MSFAEKTLPIGMSIVCDKHSCEAREVINYFGLNETVKPGAGPVWPSKTGIMALRAFEESGWTVWLGSRMTYTYCPLHTASKISKTVRMRQGKRAESAACSHGQHGVDCDKVMQFYGGRRQWRECKCNCHEMGTKS